MVDGHRSRAKLLVIAGVSAVGKSTFLAHLHGNPDAEIFAWSGVAPKDSRTFVDAPFSHAKKPDYGVVIVHFDFLYKQVMEPEDPARLIEWSSEADTYVVTVCAPAQSLYQRLSDRRESILQDVSEEEARSVEFQNKMQFYSARLGLYSDQKALLHRYQLWAKYVLGLNPRSHRLLFSDAGKLKDLGIFDSEKLAGLL
ncbi:MAG: hypothetical protein V7744_19625 [Pseudomonadales bacterium]